MHSPSWVWSGNSLIVCVEPGSPFDVSTWDGLKPTKWRLLLCDRPAVYPKYDKEHKTHAHELNYQWHDSHAALCFFVSNMLVSLLLLGCGVASQAHAAWAWQEDGAGPKLQKSGKTFRWYLPQLPLRKICYKQYTSVHRVFVFLYPQLQIIDC